MHKHIKLTGPQLYEFIKEVTLSILKESSIGTINESESHITTWYRGYNSQFNNFGSKKGLWITDSYEYAKDYADNARYNGKGKIVAFEIDESKLKCCSLYDIDEYLGEEFDPYEPDYCWENGVFDALRQDGYNCYEMIYEDAQGLYLFDTSPIIKSYNVEIS